MEHAMVKPTRATLKFGGIAVIVSSFPERLEVSRILPRRRSAALSSAERTCLRLVHREIR
jgi:hypothetical protein